jgi:hypothetical protein
MEGAEEVERRKRKEVVAGEQRKVSSRSCKKCSVQYEGTYNTQYSTVQYSTVQYVRSVDP